MNCKCIALGFAVTAMFLFGQAVTGRSEPLFELSLPSSGSRTLNSLWQPATTLNYHNGPLLTGNHSIPAYLIWYGSFNDSGKQTVRDFFASFEWNSTATGQFPSVRGWWNLTTGYVDETGAGVAPEVHLAGELDDSNHSMGASISEAMVERLVLNSLVTGSNQTGFPADVNSVYFVLTAEDVTVESFCPVCGSHDSTFPSANTAGQQLSYAWVGNSATQCPGLCAWPFAAAPYGPHVQLNSPNGDVGIDGMIINIGTLLAGMATNPFGTGYYQGDSLAPLESASACAGIYGPKAYAGEPGQLFLDPTTNASFNAVGFNDRRFLLPALWLPSNQTCTPPTMA